jgi:hypothetical protein
MNLPDVARDPGTRLPPNAGTATASAVVEVKLWLERKPIRRFTLGRAGISTTVQRRL